MSLLSRVVQEDFVWSAITNSIVGKRRVSNTNFVNINCPMCVTRGETADKRQRCGVKKNDDGVGVFCFNCGFRTKFVIGQLLSKPMMKFLTGIGLSEIEAKRINYQALTISKMVEKHGESTIIPVTFRPSFKKEALPPNSKPLSVWADEGCQDQDFLDVVTYLFKRGDAIADSGDFYWSPDKKANMNRRLLLPFTYYDDVVGYTGRLIDSATSTKTKYYSSVPPNYLFNNQVIRNHWKYIFLVEGPLDALACNGVATLGAKLTDEQAQWLESTGKTIIVVPDRDKSGSRMVDQAIYRGWNVAFPRLRDGSGRNNWWEADVNDVAKASERYGKLYTIRSLIESATSDKMQISIQQKLLF